MSDDDMAPGLPSNRVLGVPVAAAMNPLPDNCCDAICGKSRMTPSSRIWLWRASVALSLIVVMLGTVADALGSRDAVWNASGIIDDKAIQQSGQGLIPDYYLNRCTKTGVPPTNVTVSLWFTVISAILTLLSTASILYVGRGCELCCVLCQPCDSACQTNSAMGFSILFGVLSLPLFAWSSAIGYLDTEQCRSCLDLTEASCAAGFLLEYQYTGVVVAAAACGAIAIALAGAYCCNVPLAIKHAIRYKSRNLFALSGSMNLNTFINSRAALVPPNLIPSQRDEVLSQAASTAVRSHTGAVSDNHTPHPSPYVGHQASPWRSDPSPGLSFSSVLPELSLGRPASSVPPYTSGTPPSARPVAPPPRASPMLTMQARPGDAQLPAEGGRVRASPIMTATPVFGFAQPPELESSMVEGEGAGGR
eukprot:CAMPEP_0169448102 /NCGR_PEP_ID=MMETSP1042-20121227/11861_1 /TAXON_ID=464988 /ORGANISM="Hemiselmis andersenii, Strain CCMP1180" /LENGTH=419 /DNA_ID=CAMNT_0009559677 /DNA_START=263 /DNA_END=1518 /DNA_ORIENTATION=-